MTDYIEQYRILHKQGKYGTSSEKLYNDILPLVKEINPRSILDFGCGQSDLIGMLPCERKYKYDPAIKKYSVYQDFKVDLVICTDVLEHIPEEDLSNTMLKLVKYSRKIIFVISTIPAYKTLPNGTNAHCNVHPIEWWIENLQVYYPNINLVKNIRNVKFLCKSW